MTRVPGMFMIGSAGRNVGKTQLACALLEKSRSAGDIIGVKVTTVADRNGPCPRGGRGCGACSSLKGDYCITEELDRSSGKDTARLLAAGAKRVFWLRVLRERLTQGLTALRETIGQDAVWVCESNSLRLIAEPDVFLMVDNRDAGQAKASAESVMPLADRIVSPDHSQFDLDDIDLVDGIWSIRQDATGIILAGGTSGRMGTDKSIMTIGGRRMIEHIYDQLHRHFDQLLISANDRDKYAFLGVDVIPDAQPRQGPLMGIASAVAASAHQLNFVTACDIPHIDPAVIRLMLREAHGYDAVIPTTRSQRYEPLFAVYRKTILTAANRVLQSPRRKIIDIFDHCRVRHIDLSDAAWLRNLNTPDDYNDYVSNHTNGSAQLIDRPGR